MVNKILVDTNVLLDYLLEREPFFEDAKEVILSCIDGNVKGCFEILSAFGKDRRKNILRIRM